MYVEIPPSPRSRTPTSTSFRSQGWSLASQPPKLDALLSTPSSTRFWPDDEPLTFNLVSQSRTVTATSTPAPSGPTTQLMTPRRGMGIAYHELSRGTPLSTALRAIRAVRDSQSCVSGKSDLRAPCTVEQVSSSPAWVSVQAKKIGRPPTQMRADPAPQTTSSSRRLRKKPARRVLGSIYRESAEPVASRSRRARPQKRSKTITSATKPKARRAPAPKRRSFTQELAAVPPQILEQKSRYNEGTNRAKFIEDTWANGWLEFWGFWMSEHLPE